ncbi:hypothetical protein [Ralstonia insidiosa]|uniref:hypothetical protein n=1 Tax=Ralstonia insidiosa TaxID=190721 RepID=UPI001ABFD46A|nr:hypothetical protein [Ralstonia insidiosa]
MIHHIPLGPIRSVVLWLYNRITKFLLHSTYQRSHELWAERHSLGSHWDTLCDAIEYSICFAQPTDPEPRISRIAFRALERKAERLELMLEVFGGGIRYQEEIRLRDVDSSPIVRTLASVPYLDIVKLSEHGVFFTVESFKFRDCIVHYTDGQAQTRQNSLKVSLMQNWALNDTWVHRWGRWWNCNEIKYAKDNIAEYWRFWGGIPPQRSSLIGRAMGARWMVTIQFWLAIWSRLYFLSDEGLLESRSKNTSAKKSVESGNPAI